MTIAQLRQPGLDPRDIDHIVAHVTGRDLAHVLAHPETKLNDAQMTQAQALIARRLKHEPLAYLLGSQPFYGRDFFVDAAVLIPRPESELMIDDAKKLFMRDYVMTIIDVGTGSGALAITAALEWPRASVIATDISADALAVAKKNAGTLRAANITFLQGDLLVPVIAQNRQADIIFANLPYLPAEEIEESPTAEELAYEPQTALLAADGGLALIKRCIGEAVQVLRRGGQLYLEMLPGQLPLLGLWLGMQGLPYTSAILVDLSGHNRILRLTKV